MRQHVSGVWMSAIVLTFVLGTAPVFAEVQNVRVGGDLTVRGMWRDSLRFQDDTSTGVGTGTGNEAAAPAGGSSQDAFIQALLGLNVSADLTDNVSVDTRLINQRLWGGHGDTAANASTTATSASSNVNVALAYVTLKELFYSPLTVKVGRQNLWYGRGMIVGSRLLASDGDPGQTIAADEFTDDRGFDAIRATLDFNPATVDLLWSKVTENAVNAGDDVNLSGLNLGYRFPSYNAEAEFYFFNKRNADLNPLNLGSGPFNDKASVSTLGFRGSVEPVSHLTLFGELAYQFGKRDASANALGPNADSESARGDAHRAWMANLGADYVWADVQWTPRFGAEWIFYSGGDGSDTAVGGWDAMFRGKFSTLIREFQSIGAYLPSQSSATGFNALTNALTNQHSLQLRAGAKPLEDVDVGTAWTVFWADKGIHPVDGMDAKRYLGTEWDSQLLYDYTEDVQLGLIYGVLWPGHVFRDQWDSTAQELITSVKVSF